MMPRRTPRCQPGLTSAWSSQPGGLGGGGHGGQRLGKLAAEPGELHVPEPGRRQGDRGRAEWRVRGSPPGSQAPDDGVAGLRRRLEARGRWDAALLELAGEAAEHADHLGDVAADPVGAPLAAVGPVAEQAHRLHRVRGQQHVVAGHGDPPQVTVGAIREPRSVRNTSKASAARATSASAACRLASTSRSLRRPSRYPNAASRQAASARYRAASADRSWPVAPRGHSSTATTRLTPIPSAMSSSRTSPIRQPCGWRRSNRTITNSVKPAWPTRKDTTVGTYAARNATIGSVIHSPTSSVPMASVRTAAITNPPTVPSMACRAVLPVPSALERSTDSVPNTTQKLWSTRVILLSRTASPSASAARR